MDPKMKTILQASAQFFVNVGQAYGAHEKAEQGGHHHPFSLMRRSTEDALQCLPLARASK